MRNDIKHLRDKLKSIGDDFIEKGVKVPGKVNRVLFNGMNDIRNTIIITMKNTPRANWSYKVAKNKRHKPSRPGFPPAMITGELRDSYKFDVGRMQGEIGSNKKYAEWLEDGTLDGTLEPRPHLEPAFDAHKDGIMEDIADITRDIMIESFRKVV